MFLSQDTYQLKLPKWRLAFEQSDHASVAVGMYLKEEIIIGPGLNRINSSVLDDLVALSGVKNDLRDMLDQIPQSWDHFHGLFSLS